MQTLKNIFGINFQDKPEEVTKILEENYLTIKEVEDNEIISDPSLPINYWKVIKHH